MRASVTDVERGSGPMGRDEDAKTSGVVAGDSERSDSGGVGRGIWVVMRWAERASWGVVDDMTYHVWRKG